MIRESSPFNSNFIVSVALQLEPVAINVFVFCFLLW